MGCSANAFLKLAAQLFSVEMAAQPHQSAELLVPIDAQVAPGDLDLQLSEPLYFPTPLATTADGMLCVGGQLSPEWLLDAYRHGIFPWPVWDDEPMAWWSLDPRAVIELDGLHISRRLRRTLRSGKFRVTCDQDFAGVIKGCGTAPGRQGGTWLTPEMVAAYTEMHRLGHAHSVEVWHGDTLAGGTYGIAIGGLFAAESMFYYVRDASKVALAYLVAHLNARGYRLFDVQQWTPHTGRMGAVEIPRRDYLQRLATAVDLPVSFGREMQNQPTGEPEV